MRIITLLLLPILMAMAADETAELKAMQHSYLVIFGPQERAARNSSGREELVQALHRRLRDADLADIRPFMRMRLEQLLGNSRDPADAAIMVDCARSAVREAEPPYRRDLRLVVAERLMRQAQLTSGSRRDAVLRRLIDHRQVMARHAWHHERFDAAVEDHEQLARLYKAAGDRAAASVAHAQAAHIRDTAAAIASVSEQAAKAGTPGRHAELCRAFLVLDRWDLAADQARLGGDGPFIRLARTMWVVRRWDESLLAPGVASSDIRRLREHVDGGGWSAAARMLGRFCGHPDLIAQARELQLACLDEDADRAALRERVHVLCDQAAGLTGDANGIRLAGDADSIRQVLGDLATLRSEEESSSMLHTALLEAALDLATAVMVHADSLPTDLVQQVRSHMGAWQAAWDESAAQRAASGMPGLRNEMEQRLIRAGWQQIFDHQNKPGRPAGTSSIPVLEDGILVFHPSNDGYSLYELVNGDWQELHLVLETDPASSTRSVWTLHWFAGRRQKITMTAQGNDHLTCLADGAPELRIPLDGRNTIALHLRWEAEAGQCQIRVDDGPMQSLPLPDPPERLTLFQSPTSGSTVRIRSILGKRMAP